ncbi:MAG: hypothetical protein WBF66_07750 [Dehalococcoidia bacterium]
MMRYHLSAGESKVHSGRLSRRPEPFSGILAGPAPTEAPGRRSLVDTLNWKPTQEALELDGVPLAIASEMITRGEIAQRGVLAPEACIDPRPFFRRYAEHWATPPASKEEVLYEVLEE